MKHQQFNVHSTPCCLSLVVQTNQEACGWVETQEKVNTHPPLLQVDSSIFSHFCLGLFWNQFIPGDYLMTERLCESVDNHLRPI